MAELWQEVWRRMPRPALEVAAPLPCPPPAMPSLPPPQARKKPPKPKDGRLNREGLRKLPDGTVLLLARLPGGPEKARLLRSRDGRTQYAVLLTAPEIVKPLAYRRDVYLDEEQAG